MYNSGWLFYRRYYAAHNQAEIFAKLKNSKNGKRCFIIGNGPSLKSEDLDLLKGEDCFAANGIYNIFPQTVWRPTYYLIMDRYFGASPETIRDLECGVMFLGDYYCRFNTVLRKDAICLHQHCPVGLNFTVSEDISKGVTAAYTVSFVAMQIAAYMGYKEIYLLGFDHNYGIEIDDKGNLKTNEKTVSHFFKDDQPKCIIGNIEGMTKAYKVFRDYANQNHIKVRNATRGGKLEVFDRADFDSLIR